MNSSASSRVNLPFAWRCVNPIGPRASRKSECPAACSSSVSSRSWLCVAGGPDACPNAMRSVSHWWLIVRAGGRTTGIEGGRPEVAEGGHGFESIHRDRVRDCGSSQASAAALDVVGGVTDPGVDGSFHVKWHWCLRFVVRILGEDRRAHADGEHDGAVGSDGVDPTVDVPTGSPSFSVLLPVVVAASDAGVVLVGGPSSCHSMEWSTSQSSAGSAQPRWSHWTARSLAASRAAPVNTRTLRPRLMGRLSAPSTARRMCPASAARSTVWGCRIWPVEVSQRRESNPSGSAISSSSSSPGDVSPVNGSTCSPASVVSGASPASASRRPHVRWSARMLTNGSVAGAGRPPDGWRGRRA
jgi:hypothetical protein